MKFLHWARKTVTRTTPRALTPPASPTMRNTGRATQHAHGDHYAHHGACHHHAHTPAVTVHEGLGSALARHARQNLHLEAACIAACEVGELGGEFAAYASGVGAFNEVGLASGILLGFSYATYHVMRDHSWLTPAEHSCGHDHGPRLGSMRDVMMYVLTAESACVVSATSVEYAFGKFLGNSNAPWDFENLSVRLLGLPVAFGIGLLAMSIGTLLRERRGSQPKQTTS